MNTIFSAVLNISRIRNVLRRKRSAAWVTVIAMMVCITVPVSCAADPKDSSDTSAEPPTSSVTPAEPGSSGPSKPVDSGDTPAEPPTSSDTPAEPVDPGTGSVPQPDTDKAAQLQLIADSVTLWALDPDYADDRTGYAVTDLDGNGRLEVIAANQGGTGQYTYASFYEVNPDGTGLEPLAYDFPEGSSQPDIMDAASVPLFCVESSGTYTYIFRDWLKATAAEYYESIWALTLRDGSITAEALANKETVYGSSGETVRCTDSSGSSITEAEYENIASAAYPNHAQHVSAIHWLTFNRDESILSLDAATLLERLTESADNSGITEFLTPVA